MPATPNSETPVEPSDPATLAKVEPSDPALPVKRVPWWLKPRQVLRHLLALEDSDHAKALGVALGMFIGMTPTVGLQMVMVLTLALLTRRLFYFNVPAAIVTIYISNPLTVVPIYWFNYRVGKLFVSSPGATPVFRKVLEYDGFAAWWDTLTTLLIRIGPPLIVGSAIVAVTAGLLTYPAMRWLLRRLSRSETTAVTE